MLFFRFVQELEDARSVCVWGGGLLLLYLIS